MKIILDPLIFWLPDPIHNLEKEIKIVLENIDNTTKIIRSNHQITTNKSLWSRINKTLMPRLAQHINARELQPRIQYIKENLIIITSPEKNTETWGVRNLFTPANLPDPDSWMTDLARIASHWIHTGEEFALMTRLIEGRNTLIHTGAQHCKIVEKTIWEVYLKHEEEVNPQTIPCISHVRNLEVAWTRRYDNYLPDSAPPDGLAFTPIANWNDPKTSIIRTIKSKPTWIDLQGNGWSDPNTPGEPHHWDVFLQNLGLRHKFKNSYVNITRFGTNDRNRVQGQVHH